MEEIQSDSDVYSCQLMMKEIVRMVQFHSQQRSGSTVNVLSEPLVYSESVMR